MMDKADLGAARSRDLGALIGADAGLGAAVLEALADWAGRADASAALVQRLAPVLALGPAENVETQPQGDPDGAEAASTDEDPFDNMPV